MINLNDNLKQISESYHENHLSHAFLIETNDQERCLDDLKKELCKINCVNEYKEKCKNCNVCHQIEKELLPSLIIVRPDGITIKKEQVLDLKHKFSLKPVYTRFNMYVLINSERLNSSSANTMLKFIEEPEEGIIGFFIANNKENVIDTIRSRCQIISNNYGVIECSLNFLTECIEYLRDVHITSDLSVLVNRNLLEKYSFSREDLVIFFQNIVEIYYSLYRSSLGIQDCDEKYQCLSFLLKKGPSFFLKQLQLVEELEKELGYNVNINLLLDRFVLETRS